MSRAQQNKVETETNGQNVGFAFHSSPNLLHGIAQATNQLLTISDSTTAINQSLETLGQVTGVDRVYIFKIHPHPETNEPAMSQKFEWARETVTAEIDNPKLQNLTFTSAGMNLFYQALEAGKSCSGLVRELSNLERQLLEPQGILSILVVPIPVNGKLWGFIGFDDCHNERYWSKDESAVLMTMAATIGSFFAHRQAEEALQKTQLRLQQIAAKVPGMIFQFLQRCDGSRSVLYASCGCRELFELEPEEIQENFQRLSDLIHSEDRDSYEQSIASSVATGDTWDWQGRIITPSGIIKWVQGNSRLERQINGDLLWDGFLVDISEHKQTEENLRASEQRLQAFFEATFEAVIIHERGKIIDLNYATEALLGYSREELIGHSVLELAASGSRDLIQNRARIPSDQPFEAIALKKDGTTFIAEVSAKSIIYQGQKARVAGIRDITARKMAENALIQSEARNRAFLCANPDLIFRFNRDGTYLDCQAEKNSDLLAPASELIGKNLQEFVPQPVAQLFKENLEQALATGVTQTLEYKLPIKGKERYWETRLIVCGENEVLAIVRDITERKCAEEERRLTAERDRLLAEITLRIRESLNLKQILQTTVTEVRQFLGCDRAFITRFDQHLLGQVCAESVAPSRNSILDLLQVNPAFVQELKTLFKDGNIQIIDDISNARLSTLRKYYFAQYQVKACLAMPIMLSDKLFGVLVVHQCDRPRHWQQFEIDLLRVLATQLVIAVQQAQLYKQEQDLKSKLEDQVEERTKELEQKYTELQELNKIKDIFLHAVSHDLRTPVLGWLMVLKNLLNTQSQNTTDKGNILIPVSRSILERMMQSSERQLRLINSLLEVHASEVAGISLEREAVQLGELVKILVEDCEPLAAKNQATLINLVSTDLPVISADPAQLRRVFENLITNAFNHNPPGIKITLDAQVKQEMIYCTVVDNGVGISQEMCDSLFQLYYRGKDAQGKTQGHRPYTGLGLGLYLCHEIIKAHGGEIGVNSQQGVGTTFWFTLPLIIENYIKSLPTTNKAA
jgi:PAS domain S-box-containing protein